MAAACLSCQFCNKIYLGFEGLISLAAGLVEMLNFASLLQVSFLSDQLFEGEEAEAQLRKLNRRLLGRGALVNLGTMEIRGLSMSEDLF